jgi:M6 family metalloprotease-like protein
MVTYRGRKSQPASPNPHLRVAVFTVTEPGQLFGDPDQSKMQALLEPNVYDIAYDYYRENSFYTLETEFTVFGVHLGAARKPLVLPRAIASYFYDEFSPGGIEALMPGDWTDPLVLDGTESMTLHTDPAFGVGKDYAAPFAALWATRTHATYPVAVNFGGTETLQIDVEDQTGTTRTLNLDFAPLALSHAQGDDEAAFLQALGQHVTDAVRAAEAAAGSPEVLRDVVFRRIRSSTNDAEFGRLQCQLRVATASGATQKGRVTLIPPGSPPAPLVALGLTGTGARSGVLGSRIQIVNYLAECLHAARFDAGEGVGLNDPHLDTTVDAEEDVTAQEVRVRIKLAEDKGGAGAEIALVSTSGLTASGWSTAVPVAGSESTKNNRNTMRYHQELADDVFTAAMDHIRATSAWNAEAVRAQFADFDAMMIGFVGACPTSVPVADQWSSADAVDFSRLRMFVSYHQATDLNNPNPSDPPVTMGTDLLIGQRFNQFDPGVMSHEIGHGLGLPDLYSAAGFRDDVVYVDRWCQMGGGNWRFNHFCAWSKWAVGWIVEDPGDPALNRVVDVPMPDPSDTTVTEAWLFPVEYWDNTIRGDVEAEVGSSLPIGQMMKVHLGSDGGVVDLIELRAEGPSYSQELPPTPAVIVTNVLQPGTDRRWAVNGLYRRSVHLLNEGKELGSVGDSWNFAAAPEFPLKGCQVELVDLRTIRGGSIPIGRLKVTREPAEFIDLYFQDNVPSWRSPDIWVDWPGDNADPSVPRIYPEGTPTDQGETVRFPGSGVEPHFLVPRPHNAGSVHAEDVKVRWFICDPPGAGDDGRWVQRDTKTVPQIDGDTWEIAPFTWDVDSSTSSHQCLRAEIIDWTIPTGVDPATGDTLALASDDVLLQNNNAQKNVFDFEAAT